MTSGNMVALNVSIATLATASLTPPTGSVVSALHSPAPAEPVASEPSSTVHVAAAATTAPMSAAISHNAPKEVEASGILVASDAKITPSPSDGSAAGLSLINGSETGKQFSAASEIEENEPDANDDYFTTQVTGADACTTWG